MEASRFERFLEQLRAEPVAKPDPPLLVAADRYRDPAWLAREMETIFRAPRIVAASSELAPQSASTSTSNNGARGGACLPIDLPGLSALLVRDADGRVRAFANACRHRGTRLVDAPCAAKAIVCPYHGWTYGLDGALMHVPHASAFPTVDFERRGLVEKSVAERHGMIWLGDGAAAHARELDGDFAALGLDQHVLYRRARVQRRCNWKLVIEAFLDGYHIRVLHRETIYRFFLDASSVAEPAGQHIRAVTARRALREGGRPLRELGTPSFVVFPSTVIIAHPDFVSVLTVVPLAPDVTEWDHMMLVPRDRASEDEHWEKSWDLIEAGVFQREDLWVCEQIQKSIMTGATDELMFGALEEPIRWFHRAVEDALR